MDQSLLGRCGFYCGACPTYAAGNCGGCLREHAPGDCYTKDCVERRGLDFCGLCRDFPCEAIRTRPRTTLLDRDWLEWKALSDTNR